ncbi:MAG: glycosyltransferase family 4 protein [Alphaproteobacteria bacterium]|jgi:glycosyltransferase involved in cell wall biosynthesis
MKVINAFFGRKLGGIEEAFCNYAKALSDNSVEVINIINTKAQLKENLHHGEILEVRNFFKYDFLTLLHLKRILKKHQPDFIIAHGNRAGFLFSFLDKKKLICVSHNDRFKKHHFTCFANLVVNSNYKNILEESGQKRVFVAPNMVTMAKIIKEPKHTLHKKIAIGALARLHRQKGLDILLEAIAILNKTLPNLEFIIGGDGVEKQALEQQKQRLGLNNLQFVGWVKDKQKFYSNLDIFVQPSRYEPFGIVLLEAFNFEVPVIATKNDGPKEIISDGIDGILCPNENPFALAKAIKELALNKEKRTDIVINAKKKLIENYSFEVVGKKLTNILYDLREVK